MIRKHLDVLIHRQDITCFVQDWEDIGRTGETKKAPRMSGAPYLAFD
jgi:hypothetical protein